MDDILYGSIRCTFKDNTHDQLPVAVDLIVVVVVPRQLVK
jgi:hypothetical protein